MHVCMKIKRRKVKDSIIPCCKIILKTIKTSNVTQHTKYIMILYGPCPILVGIRPSTQMLNKIF